MRYLATAFFALLFFLGWFNIADFFTWFTHFLSVVLGQLDLLNTVLHQPGIHTLGSNDRFGSYVNLSGLWTSQRQPWEKRAETDALRLHRHALPATVHE